MDKTETKLAFLKRVADEFNGTLNAFSALIRLEMLVDDAERAARAFAASPPENPYARWRQFPLDIVSYYAVGYVTCLEWHVRSRLADLFTYAPGNISDDDLSKDAGTKVLRQLIAANASIPQFLAATRNYSSADTYLNTFGRVFTALKIKPDPKGIVHGVPLPAHFVAHSGLEALAEMYEYRNALVHEINDTHVGHAIHHDPWTWDAAIAYGRLTENIMRAIEFGHNGCRAA